MPHNHAFTDVPTMGSDLVRGCN